MATQLQIRRGTSAQVAAFTGAEGEIVVNTTNDSVHVNDGSTAGGFEMARADLNNVSDTDLNAALTGNTVSALTITTLTLGATAITATGTELNYVDGVTSAIQTQIDTKAPLASPTFTGTVTADGGTIVSTGSDAFSSKAVGGYAIQAYQDATSSGHTALDLRSDATTDTRYLVRGYNDAAGTPTEVFSVGADGSAFLNSNLGIGTSSPSEPLTVLSAQDYQITAAYNAANSTSYGYYGIKNNNTGNPFYFNVGGAERMRITSAGAVGIGTSSPTYTLSVNSGSSTVPASLESTGTDSWLMLKDTNTTLGNVRLGSSSNSLIAFAGGSERMRIDTSGNLLVGKTSADFNDSSRGNIEVAGTGGAILALKAGSTNDYIFNSGSGLQVLAGSGQVIQFYTNGSSTERMRIDSSGNLNVGFTSFSSMGSNNTGGRLSADGTTNALARGSNGVVLYLYSGSGGAGNITVTGNTASYNETSDQRLKENIVEAPSSSDDIDAIQVRSFDWKADGRHQKYGMIAQELNTVAPDAVTIPEDPDEMAGVDYSKLVPMLVKEIQSLRARVAQLENN